MPIKLTITDTAYRGNGVGRSPEGKALFVPYTVTGDEITANITEDKGSYAVGELQQILSPSEWRTEPHCPHHGICGGCHFGHIRYEKQLDIKKNILLQALRKHPQYPELAETIKTVAAETSSGYRIRASIRVLGHQTGFFKTNSNTFIPVTHCPVITPALWEKCRFWAEQVCSEKLISLSVMENPAGEAIALAEGPVLYDQAGFDGISDGKRYAGLPYLEYATPAGNVPVAYGGFFQSNKFLNDTFQSYAAALAADSHKILELYAGSGFFTAALIQKGTVQALELNSEAAKLGRKYGYPIRAANVTDIQKEKIKYDTVFLDPPRDGVDKKTLAAVQTITPARIIYVSCNPMTAARDLQRLESNYRIASLALFDMFPQTYHVETVTLLNRI